MATITNNTLASFATKFLTLEGEVNTTVKNLLKHHKNAGVASIDCPDQNFVFTLDDGTVETVNSAIVYLRLTSASKSSLDDLASWKYGRVVKGVMLQEYATTVYSGVAKQTVKAVKAIMSASNQLKADISKELNARIDDIKLSLAAATSEPLLTDYLEVVKGGAGLYIDGMSIDASATTRLIAIEALQEIIEQVESCFSGTRAEFDTTALDSKTIEVQLNNFDHLTMPVILERLASFNLAGKFDPDKSGILKKLMVQVLTINL